MSVFVRHADTLKGAWPRAKSPSGWKTPSRVFVKKDDAWQEIVRNFIKVVLGDPAGGVTVIDNFNLKDHLVSVGRWTAGKMRVEVTVLPNTYVVSPFLGLLSARNPKAAFTTGTGWAIGSVVTLVNRGFILGASGLPGRPRLLVKSSDPQNIEQEFSLESRATKKVAFKCAQNYTQFTAQKISGVQTSGVDDHRVSYHDISTPLLDAAGAVIGLPTDGGDAVENFTTLVLYNYGKIFGGGGGGASIPHICSANYRGWRRRGDDSGATVTRTYSEQTIKIGGFGAGDLRVTGVTAPGSLSRAPRLQLTDFQTTVTGLPNYGAVSASGLISDKPAVNTRSSLGAVAGGLAYPLSIERNKFFQYQTYQDEGVGLKPLPNGIDLAVAVSGGYSADGTFGEASATVAAESAKVSFTKGGDDPVSMKLSVHAGAGGDWGMDGGYVYVEYCQHDVETAHLLEAKSSPIVYPPDHTVRFNRPYLSLTAQQAQGTAPLPAVVRPNQTAGSGLSIIHSNYELVILRIPLSYAEPSDYLTGGGGLYYRRFFNNGYSAITWLLSSLYGGMDFIQPDSDFLSYTTNDSTGVSSVSAGAIDAAFVAQLTLATSEYSGMMKPGKGGRAVKGAAAVVFATPNNDGSYKGRIE